MADKPIAAGGTRTVRGTVADFRQLMNPQNWRDNARWLWATSSLIAPGELTADRNLDPAVEAQRVEGSWQDRRFFEDVIFGLVSRQRNILLTSYVETPRLPLPADPTQEPVLESIEFSYSQYDCLTSEFLMRPSLGGVDVDQGGALCVRVDDQHVSLTISKQVRFTQPEDELEWVDMLAQIAVKAVMELLLLGIPG